MGAMLDLRGDTLTGAERTAHRIGSTRDVLDRQGARTSAAYTVLDMALSVLDDANGRLADVAADQDRDPGDLAERVAPILARLEAQAALIADLANEMREAAR